MAPHLRSAGHSRPGGVQCDEGAVYEDRRWLPHRLLCDRQGQLWTRWPIPSTHTTGQRQVGYDSSAEQYVFHTQTQQRESWGVTWEWLGHSYCIYKTHGNGLLNGVMFDLVWTSHCTVVGNQITECLVSTSPLKEESWKENKWNKNSSPEKQFEMCSFVWDPQLVIFLYVRNGTNLSHQSDILMSVNTKWTKSFFDYYRHKYAMTSVQHPLSV